MSSSQQVYRPHQSQGSYHSQMSQQYSPMPQYGSISHSTFPPPTSHYPGPQASQFEESITHNYKPHPPTTPAQGHLAFTSPRESQSVSPVVVMSEKFAGTCHTTSPFTLTDPSWYLDSGATDHVVSDNKALLKQINYKGTHKLIVSNGQNLDITHVGHIFLPTYHFDIKLLNVLVVPKIAKNLLSVSKLSKDNNLFVEFTPTCVIKDIQMRPLLKGKLEGGLYRLLLPVRKGPCSSSKASLTISPSVPAIHQVNLDIFPVSVSKLDVPSVLTSNKAFVSDNSTICGFSDSVNKVVFSDTGHFTSANLIFPLNCNSAQSKCTLSSFLASPAEKHDFSLPSSSNNCTSLSKNAKLNKMRFQLDPYMPLSNLSLSVTKQNMDINILHQRFGHPSQSILTKILTLTDKSSSNVSSLQFCEACQFGKQRLVSFPSFVSRAYEPLSLIHTDLWGPAPVPSIDGFRYYIQFLDDHSRYGWLYPMKLKSEALYIFQKFQSMVERLFNRKIKTIQSG